MRGPHGDSQPRGGFHRRYTPHGRCCWPCADGASRRSSRKSVSRACAGGTFFCGVDCAISDLPELRNPAEPGWNVWKSAVFYRSKTPRPRLLPLDPIPAERPWLGALLCPWTSSALFADRHLPLEQPLYIVGAERLPLHSDIAVHAIGGDVPEGCRAASVEVEPDLGRRGRGQ